MEAAMFVRENGRKKGEANLWLHWLGFNKLGHKKGRMLTDTKEKMLLLIIKSI